MPTRGYDSNRHAALELLREQMRISRSTDQHSVPLAEPQVLKSAGELAFLVDQARGRTCSAAGEKTGRKKCGKNNRAESHGILLRPMIADFSKEWMRTEKLSYRDGG